MKLTILRGAHDMDMLDDIVELTKDMDVIFYEYLATKQQKRDLDHLLYRLCHEEGFADTEVGKKCETWPNIYIQLGYRLRGSKKTLVAVDNYLEEEQTPKDFMGDSMSLLTRDDVAEFVREGDVDKLFTYVGAAIERSVTAFRKRDLLVARQVKSIVGVLKEQGVPHENMALIQGYMHWSKRFISHEMPDLEIETKLYNKEVMRFILQFPYTRMLRKRLSHPGESFVKKDAEIALINLFQVVFADDDLPAPEAVVHSQSRDNPQVRRQLETIRALEKLDDEALHTEFLQLAARFRQALIDEQNEQEHATAQNEEAIV